MTAPDARRYTPPLAVAAAAALTASLLHTTPAHADGEPAIPPGDVWQAPQEPDDTAQGGDPPEQDWQMPHERESQTRADSDQLPDDLGTMAEESCDDGTNRGIQDWYPLERHQISDRLELAVNLDNGNAVLRHRDTTISGTGMDLSVSSVYNSQDLGANGWKMSTGTDVGLDIDDESGDAVLRGPSGSCETFTSEGDGEFTTPEEMEADLNRQDNGRYSLDFHAGPYADQMWDFTADGWLYAQSDHNGNSITLGYDSDGLVSSLTDTQDRTTSIDWHEQRIGPTELADPTGTTAAEYTYNADGLLDQITDRDGNELSFGYDDDQHLAEITDARGNDWQLSYDAGGRVTSLTEPVTDEEEATTSYSYEDDTTEVTDARGNAATHTFDEQGRQEEATDAEGHSQSASWTGSADIASVTDPAGASTTYDYDDLNNMVGTELPTGAEYALGYGDSANPHRPTGITGPEGDEVELSYDERGNLTEVHYPDEDVTEFTYTYNNNGTLASETNAEGATTEFSYDDQGNLTEIDQPGQLGSTTFTYDSLSRVVSQTDGNGTRLDYAYDALDRVVEISQDDDLVQSMEYDANGNLSATHTSQASLVHSYDHRGAHTSTGRDDGDDHELTSYSYDEVGNLAALTTQDQETSYAYDEANRLVALTDPLGDETTFVLDETGQRTGTDFPDGAAQSNTFDETGRLVGLEMTDADDSVLLEAEYSYTTGDGEDAERMQERTVNGESEEFSYDELGRLTSNGEVDYTYDDAGNLLSAGDREYAYSDANQAIEAEGSELEYDQAGNLVEVGSDTELDYSSTGQMTERTEDGASVLEVGYDTFDQTQRRTITDATGEQDSERTLTNTALGVSVLEEDGQDTHAVRDPEGQLVSLVDADEQERFHAALDQQNSTLALHGDGVTADEADVAYDYEPYGQSGVTASGERGEEAAQANPFTFIGGYELGNGDQALGHRYLSGSTSQFTQQDPSWIEGNLYAYSEGDPINKSDPSGLSTVGASIRDGAGTGAAIGGSVGCVGGGAVGAVTGAPALGLGSVGGAAVGCVGGFGLGTAVGTTIGTAWGAGSHLLG